MQLPDAGVFAIDKPQYFTSFDVVAKLRGILGIRRIGHGGTLDPLATGVLPIFIGKATKAVDLIAEDTKRYTATASIGTATDTGDITGDIIERCNYLPNEISLKEAVLSFTGLSEQIPPMYSAIKIDGRPLYDIARSGKTIERQPRSIEIFTIDLLDFDIGNKTFTIDVLCSKGTYIRVLVEDIARKVNTVATLSSLRRTKSGLFHENDCYTFESIESFKRTNNTSFIQSVETLFPTLEIINLTEIQYKYFTNGVVFPIDIAIPDSLMFKVFYEGSFIAISKLQDGKLKSIAKFI